MPDIQDISLEDVLADAEDLGLSAQDTAAGVKRWRDKTYDWASQNAEPDKLFTGTHELDRRTAETLGSLRQRAAADAIQSVYGDDAHERDNFLYELEASGWDPESVDQERFGPAAQAIAATAKDQAFHLPRQRADWLPVSLADGNELGRFAPIRRPDGSVDIALGYDEQTGGNAAMRALGGVVDTAVGAVTVPLGRGTLWDQSYGTERPWGESGQERKTAKLTVPAVTDDEIKAAHAQAIADAAKYEEHGLGWMQYESENPMDIAAEPGGGMGFAGPQPTESGRYFQLAAAQRQRAEQLAGKQARDYLMAERVGAAIKAHPELRDKVGKKDFGEDFHRGLTGFFLGSRVAWNDVTGDDKERDKWRGYLAQLPQLMPGSTQRRNVGGISRFGSEAVEGLGGMTPQILASVAAPGLSGVARAAVMPVSMANIGFSSYGSAVASELDRADALDKEGKHDEAQTIRDNYRLTAAAKAGVEVASEFILPEEKLLTGAAFTGGFKRRLATGLGKSYLEGHAAELGSQVVDAIAHGDPLDLGKQIKGGLMEATVGAPLIGLSALRSPHHANVTDGSPTNAPGSYPASEVSGDAGSTPAVGALSIDPAEPQLPPEQQAAVDAAMQTGPRSLLEVAQRGGRVDSGRLHFSLSNTRRAERFSERAGQGSTLDTANQHRVANAFHEAVATDLNGAIQTYIDNFGNVVDTDLARELDPEYAASREGRQEHSRGTSHTANTLAKYVYERLLKLVKPGEVIFNAGGPGSGKSSTLDAETKSKAAIVYDTVMAEAPRAIDHINQALDAGHRVTINYIHQPLEAAVRNTIDRAAHKDNGRIVEAYATARAHKNAQDTIFKVASHFANDPRVTVRVRDNTGFANRPSSLAALHQARYQEPVETLIQRATVEAQRHLHERTQQDPAAYHPGLQARVLRTLAGSTSGTPSRSNQSGHRSGQGATGRARTDRTPEARTPLRSLVQNTRKVASEAARLLNNALPGIVHDKLTFVANPAELLASNYAAENTFTPAEIEQMQEAEAFFNNDTGHTIVFTDHIDVRPGESERAAVARVILHERVGHDGFNHLYERDEEFKTTWDKIVKGINSTELDAIAGDYPDLAGDRNQLALEWFARQVERIAGESTGAKLDGGLKGIVRQMWAALEALYARIFRAFAQSLQTEHELRQLITQATAAARNGTAIPTTAEGLRLQFSLLSRGRQAVSQGVDDLRSHPTWRWLMTGSTLPRAFYDAVQATERERTACNQAAAQIGKDLDTAVNAHAKRTNTPVAQVYDMVAQAMTGAPGTNAVLLAVDPVLSERARVARNFMDDMSRAIGHTLPAGELRNNIMLNQGAWMRRSFAAFDPNSNWNFDNVMKAAREGQDLAGKPAVQIVKAAAKLLTKQNGYVGQLDANGLPKPGSVMEADMRDLMDRTQIDSALTGQGPKVRKNVSSLLVRKDIPAELRALMGEELNPIKRFIASTSFQTQYLRRHQQQLALRTIGLNGGLFSRDNRGRFTQQIPKNVGWSPLAGLWVEPDLWTALQQVDTTKAGEGIGASVLKLLKFTSSEAKFNKVAMSPDSWMVNALGNVSALTMTGDVFSLTLLERMRESHRIFTSQDTAKSGDALNQGAEVMLDARRALIERLTAEGVLNESFSQRDLEATLDRSLLAWVETQEATMKDRIKGGVKGALYAQAAARGGGLPARAIAGIIGGAAGSSVGAAKIESVQRSVTKWVMAYPDQLGRLIGYMGNVESAIAAGLQGDQAIAEAVERTRNTFPDYSKVPKVVRDLSTYGSFIAPVGSFVAFQWELYRNFAWNAYYALTDIRSGNGARAYRGGKRILGASLVSGALSMGLQALLENAIGANDDDNKKWRKHFARPWEAQTFLCFYKWDQDRVSYFNPSYLLPQTSIGELVKAVLEGESPGDAANRGGSKLYEQFMGGNIAADAIMASRLNVTRTGRPITYRDGWLGFIDRANYAVQNIAEPGWAAKIERLTYAFREAKKNGREFSFGEELQRLLGIRSTTMNWTDLVERGYRRYSVEYYKARSQAKQDIDNGTPGAVPAALSAANARIRELQVELQEYERDLRTFRIPESTIKAAGKPDGFTKHFDEVGWDSREEVLVRLKR